MMDFPELTFYLVLFKMLSCNMSYVLPDNFPKVVAAHTKDICALCLDYHFRIHFNYILCRIEPRWESFRGTIHSRQTISYV